MWRLALLVTLTASLLIACGTPATPAPIPTSTPPPPPTQTPVPPTSTATLEPSPTPDPLIFRDDFDGALDEAWQWIHEKPAYWSLTTEPGWLRITARAGGLNDGTMTNVLVQPAPEGNYELETKLNFRPGGNYQLAGLLIYKDDGNTVAFGRAFCGNSNCSGDGFYFDMVMDGNWNGQNYGTKAPDTNIVYLRLRQYGDTYTASASEDGQTWRLIGVHDKGPLKPIFVGLISGNAQRSVPRVAAFDYFTITALR